MSLRATECCTRQVEASLLNRAQWALSVGSFTLRRERHHKALVRHLCNTLAIRMWLDDTGWTIYGATLLWFIGRHVLEDIFNLGILHRYLTLESFEIIQKGLILLDLDGQSLDDFPSLLVSVLVLRLLDWNFQCLDLALKHFNVFGYRFFEENRQLGILDQEVFEPESSLVQRLLGKSWVAVNLCTVSPVVWSQTSVLWASILRFGCCLRWRV